MLIQAEGGRLSARAGRSRVPVQNVRGRPRCPDAQQVCPGITYYIDLFYQLCPPEGLTGGHARCNPTNTIVFIEIINT